MLPDRVSNPGPLTYESGALPIALRDPARKEDQSFLVRKWSLQATSFRPNPFHVNYILKVYNMSYI